ncbi:MAG: hypothetical protein ACW99F_13170 [Candidatus Hodarchaeales archaeon]|jgi:hypothetical protein
MRIWNNLSCGVKSTAMALKFPKITNVMVNTGGNKIHSWKTHNQLQHKRIRIIVLSSAVGGYPTYYDYIRVNGLVPFYVSCCYKAKEMHLDRFYRAVGPAIVNVGFIKGEEDRATRLSKKNTSWRKFNFPMLDYTQEQCEKILRANDVQAQSSFCWYCPKGENPPKWATDPLEAKALQARSQAKGLYKEV